MEERFPTEELYSQYAAGESGKVERFPDGSWISYERILGEELTLQQRTDLRNLLLFELEIPAFHDYSPEMPYTPDELDALLENPEAVVIVAWKIKNNEKELVGYVSGMPGVDEELTEKKLTTAEGKVLEPPDDKTYFFDTYAVKEGERSQQIGKTLAQLFRQWVFRPGGNYDSLAVMALEGARTLDMLEHDNWLGLGELREQGKVSEGVVPYRGWRATYLKMKGLDWARGFRKKK